MRRIALPATLALLAACVSVHSAALGSATTAAGQPVLGSQKFTGKHGEGFGTVAPETINNGGVPSGIVNDIVWQNWGGPVATGSGLTYIYMPRGGYYEEQGQAELRAKGLGHCRDQNGKPRKRLAYRRLYARVVDYPGGPFGKWFRWSGARTICNRKL
jgi:hypothetical protein